MRSRRVSSLILAVFMTLTLLAPAFSALAEGETLAPVESQAPVETPKANQKVKQYKVKFVDQVTGKQIGETQRVNAGEAAAAPEAPYHSDLGFQFAGWSRDFSAIKKNTSVDARYVSNHQMVLGEFDTAQAAPGGTLKLMLPVAFKNALTGEEAASNTLADGKKAGYDAKRAIADYDQTALAKQGIEWIRVDLDLSGTPLKGDRDARSSYILKSVKDSKKKYGVENGQPVNRGFAAFGDVKAKADAKSGTYALKGTIVWRLRGTKLDNKVPFEINLKIGGKAEVQDQDGAASSEQTAQQGDAIAPDDSDILVANQAKPGSEPVVQILSPESTPGTSSTPEVAATPGAAATPEVAAMPGAAATPEATATPEAIATPEASPAPEVVTMGAATAAPEVTAVPEAAGATEAVTTPEAAATPDATTPEATATPDATTATEESDDFGITSKGATNFTAKDTQDTTSYTVTFTDYDGSTIATTTVQSGYTPSAPGNYVVNKSPIKKINDDWCVFSGWDQELTAVTYNISIKAQYTALPGSKEVNYKDQFDNKEYGTDKVAAEAAANSHDSLGYKFTGWKETATTDGSTIFITATAQYDVTAKLAVCPRSFATGKPKDKMTIALPVSYTLGSVAIFSDMLSNGKRAEKYTGKESPSDFDHTQFSALGVKNMWIILDDFDSDDPVTASSLSAYYVVKDGKSNGFAVFDNISVKSSATNGYYPLTGRLFWQMQGQPDEVFSSIEFTTQIRVTGASTSSGGSSYAGGGATTGKEKPQAKLVVEAITTDPLSPKAGENFDIVLSLKNTSLNYYVQNVEMTYTSEEDALVPTAGSNSVYIAKIDKGESFEQRLPVKSSPELAKEDVKVDLSMEYEDKKMTALTATQSVMVKVAQVQRIQLDTLQLPTSAPAAGDSAQVSLGIFNLGRTILYNVTAKVVSDNPNLSPGQTFFGGNMDPGTSKTAELEVTPIEAGQYNANVQVTYENAAGEVFTETRPFTLNVNALEDFGYDESQYDYAAETPAPEAPSAAQIMQYLPLWLYAAVGLILLIVVLAIAMSARRRRRRMFEDDEMD